MTLHNQHDHAWGGWRQEYQCHVQSLHLGDVSMVNYTWIPPLFSAPKISWTSVTNSSERQRISSRRGISRDAPWFRLQSAWNRPGEPHAYANIRYRWLCNISFRRRIRLYQCFRKTHDPGLWSPDTHSPTTFISDVVFFRPTSIVYWRIEGARVSYDNEPVGQNTSCLKLPTLSPIDPGL